MEHGEATALFDSQLPNESPGELAGGIRQAVLAGGKFDRFKGLSMALLGAILWGVSGTAAQVLFQRYHVDPAWLVSVRMSIAGVLLLIGAWVTQGPGRTLAIWKSKRDAAGLVLLGVVGLLGVQYSYFAAIGYGNAATATILQYMSPVFITAYVALRQRSIPRAVQLTAVLLSLTGAYLLVTNGDWRSFSIAPAAVVWGLISAVTAAFYTLYPRELLRRHDAAAIAGWGMLLGGSVMSFIAPPWRFSGQSSWDTWWLVGFVVLFGTLVAFYVYIASLKYISSAEASVLASGEPLSAAMIAVAFLHVQMGLTSLVGGLCIVVTVTILARSGSAEGT